MVEESLGVARLVFEQVVGPSNLAEELVAVLLFIAPLYVDGVILIREAARHIGRG